MCSEEVQIQPEQLQVSGESMVVATSSSAGEYISEEVIISEPAEGNEEVEVLVEEEGSGIVIVPTTSQVSDNYREYMYEEIVCNKYSMRPSVL